MIMKHIFKNCFHTCISLMKFLRDFHEVYEHYTTVEKAMIQFFEVRFSSYHLELIFVLLFKTTLPGHMDSQFTTSSSGDLNIADAYNHSMFIVKS